MIGTIICSCSYLGLSSRWLISKGIVCAIDFANTFLFKISWIAKKQEGA
jgi:hypothetical protein